MSKRMALALKGLRAGEIGFTRFAVETREDWDKLAGRMFTDFSRKGLPAGITLAAPAALRRRAMIGSSLV